MATFTKLLRDVMADYDVERVCLRDYPIFDEGYRKQLNNKILTHYKMQEIGTESVDLFFFYLRRSMNENMPTFNQFYESTRIKFDPLSTLDMSMISDSLSLSTANNSDTATTTGKNDSTAKSVSSDFPQTQLSENKDYATSANDSGSTSSTSSDSSTSSTSQARSNGKNTTRQTGRAGSVPQILMELRSSFVNVDVMVIDSLSDLFMGVWDNGDYHTATSNSLFYPYYSVGVVL